MNDYNISIHEITNEELYIKDLECERYNEWNRTTIRNKVAYSIKDALESVTDELNKTGTPWESVTYDEYTGKNERGQDTFLCHSIKNNEYVDKLHNLYF